jgi:4-hydroxy 2-oxovalerate aldolase
MSRFKLLDCTLRDGGYINNWNFGFEKICSIIKKLIETETNYIEIGFLRNCEYNKNITLYNNVAEARNVLPAHKGNSKYSLMALHNLYDVNKLETNDGTIDIVRVTFHNYDVDEGIIFVQKVMDKGYKVFCNPINIMGYTDTELLVLLEKVNRIFPHAFSIVDTFGSMMKSDLLRIYLLIEHNLDKSIQIGLHLHENLGLAYSLAQNFIEICAVDRNAVIDGSLFGMGRVPGNLCIELVMDYMNRYQNGQYNPNAAYDAIDDYIAQFKEIEAWGYSTAYALSAKYNLHRNYSEYLLGKGNLRAKDINQILAGVEESKKAAYDKNYIEKLYSNYQNDTINDEDAKKLLQQILYKKDILLLAPGNSLNTYKDVIEEFIAKNELIIISANYDDNVFGAQYSFYSNIKRFDQYITKDSNKTILITSNIYKATTGNFITYNYYDLACNENDLYDNCVIMLLRLLNIVGITEINIAGFDGFSDGNANYAYLTHTSDTKNKAEQNKTIANHIAKLKKKLKINFITPSLYIK